MRKLRKIRRRIEYVVDKADVETDWCRDDAVSDRTRCILMNVMMMLIFVLLIICALGLNYTVSFNADS